MDNKELAKYIDLTLLKPDATSADIAVLYQEAIELGTYAVCVNPVHVTWLALLLRRSPVLPIAVVGFPFGANVRHLKAVEAGLAISHGAKEIDMVPNLGALRDRNDQEFLADIVAVAEICRQFSVPLKVILETALFDPDDIIRGCELAERAGAQFVKTSTGSCKPTQHSPSGGATIEAVRAMHRAVGGRLGIKASGKVDSRAFALALIEAGATRIGAGVDNALAILAD